MKEIDFCNQDCALANVIPQFFNEFILKGIDIEIIKKRYETMRNNFDSLISKWNAIDKFETGEYGDLKIPISHLKFEGLTEVTNAGLDLPTWFNYERGKRTVMILAMEPLRKPEQSFKGYATLASPFALHHKNARCHLPYSTTYKFIRELVDNDFNVYLTDIYKLYCLFNNQKYTGEKALNHEIFKRELDILKPKYIVVFGKTAKVRLNEFINLFGEFDVEVISLAHPAAFGGNKQFFIEFNRIINS